VKRRKRKVLRRASNLNIGDMLLLEVHRQKAHTRPAVTAGGIEMLKGWRRRSLNTSKLLTLEEKMGATTTANKNKKQDDSVRLSLDVSGDMNDSLEKIADDLGTSKSDVLRRAVVLLEIIYEAQKEDGELAFGLTRNNEQLDREIIGFLR
jgi:hypothetical protein